MEKENIRCEAVKEVSILKETEGRNFLVLKGEALSHGAKRTRETDAGKDQVVSNREPAWHAHILNVLVDDEDETRNSSENPIIERADCVVDVFHHAKETVVYCVKQAAENY